MLVLFNQDALSEFHRLVRITQLLNQLQLQITKKMKKKNILKSKQCKVKRSTKRLFCHAQPSHHAFILLSQKRLKRISPLFAADCFAGIAVDAPSKTLRSAVYASKRRQAEFHRFDSGKKLISRRKSFSRLKRRFAFLPVSPSCLVVRAHLRKREKKVFIFEKKFPSVCCTPVEKCFLRGETLQCAF
jgi:hypothetical protein